MQPMSPAHATTIFTAVMGRSDGHTIFLLVLHDILA